MTLLLSQIVEDLLTGRLISWPDPSGKKTLSCQLNTPAERRLFEHLLTLDAEVIAAPDTPMFDSLIACWDSGHDPNDSRVATEPPVVSGPWYLSRIKTENFGGINLLGGAPFELSLADIHLSLEGDNGSGKTSLISAILWGLTGYRVRKQDTPILESGDRKPVYDCSGKKIGGWPPIVTYPTDPSDLKLTASVRVRLDFEGPEGQIASVERSLMSPMDGPPVLDVTIDEPLQAAPHLIEAGLLMPARLSHVAFGDKDKSVALYSAIKALTGLDQLADIATGVVTLRRGNGKFRRYAKDQGAERLETIFSSEISRAREFVVAAAFDLPTDLELTNVNLKRVLSEHISSASCRAAGSLSDLKTRIDQSLNLDEKIDRERLQNAVAAARYIVNQGGKGVELFSTWKAITAAKNDGGFEALPIILDEIQNKLAKAQEWHELQKRDEKLRLKALASRFYVEPSNLDYTAECPLCESKLANYEQRALAEELKTLKASADEAERSLKDACSDLSRFVDSSLPEALTDRVNLITAFTPRTAFSLALRRRFVNAEEFETILTGFSSDTESLITSLVKDLPDFVPFSHPAGNDDAPSYLRALNYQIAEARYAHALCLWWSTNGNFYHAVWTRVLGERNKEGEYPLDCLNGLLGAFEIAFSTAGPLDKIVDHLSKAKSSFEAWSKIDKEQCKRDAIALALEPLRMLANYVDYITQESLENLSGRMSEIIDAMSITDRFTFDQAMISKKAIAIKGSFSKDIVIDATLVANTSWLRGVLWAFVFAFREQCVRDLGVNAIPLMLLDDPQATFDTTNERLWARDLSRRCRAGAEWDHQIQLLLVTHCRRFFTTLTKIESVPGECGKMVGPTGGIDHATILNGTKLDRLRDRAETSKDSEDCFAFVAAVRVYCEDLLRIMLRGQASEIAGDNVLSKLIERLGLLHKDQVQPFAQTPFRHLIGSMNSTASEIKAIKSTHHEDEGTIGYGVFKLVLGYWNKSLGKSMDHAFSLATEHASFSGNPEYFPWADNVVTLPLSQKENLAGMSLHRTGVVAAATTDGRVGDGLISVTEKNDSDDDVFRLLNHSVYRISTSTLSPIAEPGDVVIVRNYGAPMPRNLVVVAHGTRLLVRRLNDAEGHENISVLTGQASNPYSLPDTVIALKDKIEPKKIIGTLFMAGSVMRVDANLDEFAPVGDFSSIRRRIEGARLLRVSGQSMEPIALDGQYVMVSSETIESESLGALEGQLVIAASSSGRMYFKRLRIKGNLVVLESVNSEYSTGIEILSISPESGFDRLAHIYAVRGVLFEAP